MARYDHSAYAMADEDTLWFGGLAVRGAGRNNIDGTAGDDVLDGTVGGDNFRVDQGGDDTLRGAAGNDHFFFGSTYTDKDVLYGGAGTDRLILSGTSDRHLVLGPENFRDIEGVKVADGTFDIVLKNGISDLRMTAVGGFADLSVDGSDVSGVNIRIVAGLRADTLIGGSGDDILAGSFGADILTGGGGADRFKYRDLVDSTERTGGATADTIIDFSQGDRILLPVRYNVDFHFGATAEHTGDVVSSYDQVGNQTRLGIYIDSDNVEDMAIYLNGRIEDLEVIHGTQIVLA